MPVLAGEFVCPHCGAKLRVQQRGRVSLSIDCPECQAPLMVQLGISGQLEVATPAETLSTLAPAPTLWQRWGSVSVTTAVVLLLLVGLWQFNSSPREPADSASPPVEVAADSNPEKNEQAAGSPSPSQGPVRPVATPQTQTEKSAAVSPVSASQGQGNSAEPEKLPEHPFASRLEHWGGIVNAYRESRGAFPPALWERQSQPPEAAFSWLAGLDPALEKEASLLPQWNLPWDDPLNDRFVRRKRADLLNPSIPSQASADRYPATHLVGMAGVGDDAAELPVTHPRAGIFGWNRTTRVEDVKDGLSNTLLAAGVNGKVGSWAEGTASIRPLTMEPYINGPDGLGTGQKQGMFVLMADGSVRFLNQKTSPVLIRRMAAIADGLPLDESVPGEPGETGPPQEKTAPEKVAQMSVLPPATSDRGNLGEAPAPEAVAVNVPLPNPAPPRSPPSDAAADIPADLPPAIDFESLLSQTVLVYQLTSAAPLDEVLAEIEALLGAPIQFSVVHLPPGSPQRRQPVSINRKNATFRDLLDDALEETSLTYLLESQRIVILPQEVK